MLVLSRRENDKILFPNLGVTIEIVRIKGSTVRVGINAPRNVSVLRHEVAEASAASEPLLLENVNAACPTHRLRNRLNTANLALHLLGRQLEAGLSDEAEKTLQKALSELEVLDQEFDPLKGRNESGQDAKGRRSPWRALLVEDDENECELLAGYMRMRGFEVETAGDGLTALRYLSQNRRPDVVLLDMRMPRLDGPKTVSSIRRDPAYQGLKLFAVSGTDPSEVGVITGPEGIDRWFCKPLNPETLVREVNRELQPTLSIA